MGRFLQPIVGLSCKRFRSDLAGDDHKGRELSSKVLGNPFWATESFLAKHLSIPGHKIGHRPRSSPFAHVLEWRSARGSMPGPTTVDITEAA